MKSETKYEDMICVMDEVQEYIPTVSTSLTVDVDEEEEENMIIDDFHPILVGGDMLTTARARGSQRIRRCGERAKERLEGVIPVREDWHCKGVLLGVSNTHTLVRIHAHY